MRLTIAIIMLSYVFILPFAAAKDYEDVPPERIFTGKQGRYGHLEYVGFYGSALHQWNFTEELAGFTNITWVTTGSINTAIERIREAAQNDVEVALSVQPYVFNSDYELNDDYLSTLSDLQRRLEVEGLTEHIAMLYPIDEPYLHAANSTTTDREQMYQDILDVNQDLEALFPGVPIGVIFYSKELLRGDFRLPESYDWVGFDCYRNIYDCRGRPFTDYYSILLTHMSPEQDLMAVPQTWVRFRDYDREFYEPTQVYEKRIELMVKSLKKRLRHHYEIALSEPRFVAFIPFLWSMEPVPGRPPYPGFGADEFGARFPEGGEAFVAYLTRICLEIKTAQFRYPNLARRQTEFSLNRPPNRYGGEILGVADNGRVSAWGINWTLPHKSLRMQLLLQRGGEEIYESPIKRSFILDDSLAPEDSPDLPAIGVHGYRHKLPRDIVRELRGKSAVVKLRIFGDGADAANYREIRQKVKF